MANTALQKIARRTKQIRAAHPNMAFRTAQKKASAEYRSGKISGVKKKKKAAPKKKAAKKHKRKGRAVGATPRVRVIKETRMIGTMPEVRKAMKQSAKVIKEELGWQYVNIRTAKTQKEKNKYRKRAKELEADLRKLS